ncbi:MAG: 3-oxoacyl-ACP reductase FabG [Spirochaetota bacterium]|jgi:3-oxoacyl-[acyl-carrier protein] reductase|nr:3-oxoacyl-ACP reductase FabG [Spirochaetota bacterium]NMA56906.1 3-oxoacyl-ACP reductase FabG [Treponema sp.]HBG36267.1 3-oxoacyl-ACP reductase [Treponema sp.]HPY52370.1 3-oxoacyl-ACP reductase FabG [Treponemataceae bacterium]
MLLKGKTALVTGTYQGIGVEIVKRYLEEGASVWGVSIKPSPVKEELEAYAKSFGGSFTEIYADVSNKEEVVPVLEKALKDSGGFDILVNNAGITRDGLSFRMSMKDWDDVIRVNLTSVFIVSQVISSDMIKKRKGSIINMSSIVGLHGQGGQVNYSASKAGLIGYSKSLAKEVAGRGVRVNLIAPGFIDTDMTQAIPEEARAKWLETIPMKKGGTMKNVADSCVFLASDLSSYITAQIIGVDGGMGA